MVATPRPIMLRALQQCRVRVTKAIQDRDDFGNLTKEFSGLVRATDGDRYCTIYFYEPDKKNLTDSKIWLHCSCPHYTFNVEVVNTLKHSSDILNSNGELPVVRNPRMIPHLCKHLVALSRLALVAKYQIRSTAASETSEPISESKPSTPPLRTLAPQVRRTEPGTTLRKPKPIHTGIRPPARPPAIRKVRPIG